MNINKKPIVITISGKMGSGKDTVAKYLKEELEKSGQTVLITHYADLLKYICKTFLEWDGKKDDAGRKLLQTVGTDIFRRNDENFFCTFLVEVLKNLGWMWDFVLIPDARFQNEIECIKSIFRTISILVVREVEVSRFTSNSEHISEHSLDGYKFDMTFENNAGIEKVRGFSEAIASDVLCQLTNDLNK